MITRAVAYWLKVTQMEASRLPKICLDKQQILNFQRYSWLIRLSEILNRYGLGFPLCDTLKQVKQRIKDVHGQIDITTLSTNGSLGLLTVAKTTFTLEKYLYLEMPSLERELFVKFRFELLDTNVKFGRYRKIRYNDRTCVCRANAIEDTLHIIFDCSLYREVRKKYLAPIVDKFPHWDVRHKLIFLLKADSSSLIRAITGYLKRMTVIRASYIEKNFIDCKKDELN
ncbi:hypothetical protein E2320_022975 [Naja naja]|nr:hypothetical protein E2320_022975 [Naja naja]